MDRSDPRRLARVLLLPTLSGSLGIILAAPAPTHAQAANQATATVTFVINPVDALSISGNPELLLLSPSGSSPDTAVDASTTWSLTTNQENRKITASLDAAMPPDVQLAVRLQAPPGATSAGSVDIGVDGRDLVVGLGPTSAAELTVAYTLSASITAGALRGTRIVTFTILGDV